jgi:hypothetical protein
MLEHLLDYEPPVDVVSGFGTPVEDVAPQALLDAQANTADWLQALGAPAPGEAERLAAASTAQAAFQAIVTQDTTPVQRAALVALKTPAAVRHLTGMLTAYDWEFVQQAKEIRGYAVAQLIEETKSTNANIRLKALGLLGKVTEVGLFTDKLEVKKAELSDSEIDAKIKEKLSKFMGVIDVVDVSEKPVEDIDEPKQPDDINEG